MSTAPGWVTSTVLAKVPPPEGGTPYLDPGVIPLLAEVADGILLPRAHGFGAAQTADQSSLFGGFVRDTCLLSAPVEDEACLAHLAAVVALAVARATGTPRGPVHLNAPFREPLAPPGGHPGPIVDPPIPAIGASCVAPDVTAVAAAGG